MLIRMGGQIGSWTGGKRTNKPTEPTHKRLSLSGRFMKIEQIN